ncbi:hypothetical protein D3C78_19340 [compost metagenome]
MRNKISTQTVATVLLGITIVVWGTIQIIGNKEEKIKEINPMVNEEDASKINEYWEQKDNIMARPGTAQEMDGLIITVQSMRTSLNKLSVDLDVHNTSKEALIPSATIQMRVSSSDGKIFAPHDNPDFEQEIMPGQTISGTLEFPISGHNSYKFMYISMDLEEHLVWLFTQ